MGTCGMEHLCRSDPGVDAMNRHQDLLIVPSKRDRYYISARNLENIGLCASSDNFNRVWQQHPLLATEEVEHRPIVEILSVDPLAWQQGVIVARERSHGVDPEMQVLLKEGIGIRFQVTFLGGPS